MSNQEFPYTGWILMPSFKPAEVTVIGQYKSFTTHYHTLASGKIFHPDGIFPTKADAIADGFKRLDKQQADLNKKQEKLDKRAATLNKHKVEAAQ